MSRDSRNALEDLYGKEPRMRELGNKAVGILVFPSIVKGGFLVGAEYGNGTLFRKGKDDAFYNMTAVSFGLQAGGQTFGYALFFMNDWALQYLNSSDGWSLGAGPSLVLVDKGFSESFTTTTLTQDVYAVPFGQQGLMAGMGLQGSKITRTYPN